jgi:hypothetical protein
MPLKKPPDPEASFVEEVRYTWAHAIIATLRLVHQTASLMPPASVAHNEHVIIGMAIWIGQHERRRFTIAKLALYLGLPRATVHKRVHEMIDRGVLKKLSSGELCYTDGWLKDPIRASNARHFAQILFSACRRLSQYDTMGVDGDGKSPHQ